MPKVNIDGLSLYYDLRQQGNPDDVLLLLHGFTGRSENWEYVRQRLECPTLTIDLPGHGRSDAPDSPCVYAMEVTAQRTINLLDQLGLEQVHLLGYSMGGRLSFYLALHHAERIKSVILESTSPGLATEEERQARRVSDAALADRIERHGIEDFVDFWENIPLFASQKSLPDQVQAHHRELRLQNNPQGLANSLRGMGTGSQPALWSMLGQVQQPVMLIAGGLDTKYVAITQQVYQRLQDATLHLIFDAGHTVHLEQPERYIELVNNFLKE